MEQAVAAPYVSGRLAEAGARVIKIERPEGDFARGYDTLVKDQSAYFVWLNAGKESVVLDLKESGDAKLLSEMLARADVFIQNLAPGALARLGFAPEELRQRFPSLIVCSISGYGESGPYRNQKAYDLLIQAETGLCSITGIEDQLTRVGVSVSDISAGMTAHSEILRALFARERDPERNGRLINVSLFHSTADWMNVPYLQFRYGGFTPGNHGLKHPSIAPYGAFGCKDGRQVLISIQNEREWRDLCRVALQQADLADDPRFLSNAQRVLNRDVLDPLIEAIFQQTDLEAMVKRLDEAKVAYGRVSSLGDLMDHPQNRFRQIRTSRGSVAALGRGAELPGETSSELAVPDLGQHTSQVREEFMNKR